LECEITRKGLEFGFFARNGAHLFGAGLFQVVEDVAKVALEFGGALEGAVQSFGLGRLQQLVEFFAQRLQFDADVVNGLRSAKTNKQALPCRLLFGFLRVFQLPGG